MSYVQPLPGYLTVEQVEQETTTDSGIILAEGVELEPKTGRILLIGSKTDIDGRDLIFPLKEGDVIVYKEWGGKEFKHEGKDLLILKFEDVIAVINSDKK